MDDCVLWIAVSGHLRAELELVHQLLDEAREREQGLGLLAMDLDAALGGRNEAENGVYSVGGHCGRLDCFAAACKAAADLSAALKARRRRRPDGSRPKS